MPVRLEMVMVSQLSLVLVQEAMAEAVRQEEAVEEQLQDWALLVVAEAAVSDLTGCRLKVEFHRELAQCLPEAMEEMAAAAAAVR